MLLFRALALGAHFALVVPYSHALTIHEHASDDQHQKSIFESQFDIPLGTTFRDVQDTDLDEIATVVVEAFAPSAAWHYMMPTIDQHMDELIYCLRQDLCENWKARDRNSTFGKVITVPSSSTRSGDSRALVGNSDEERSEKVVAIAFWIVSDPDNADAVPFNPTLLNLASMKSGDKCSPLPFINVTRAVDMNQQNEKYEQYMDEKWPRQVYLNTLATHPDWDGHGFGARHCRWGMEMARQLELPIVLLATPAGWPLYDSLGFESVMNATLTRLDGEGMLWNEIMDWSE